MISIPSSHEGLSLEEALEMCNNLCKISIQFYEDHNLNDLHKSLKQLMRLYFDCKDSRNMIGDHLLSVSFEIFAVKVMKQLNNSGVFKDDDVWFTTFYLYNICWNYSEANPKFASKLISSGIETLLFSNISHTGYIDNLTKNNVYYLIKSSLSILHNILRTPGHRQIFNQTKVIESLINLTKRDDLLAVLATVCLAFIACNENLEILNFGILLNIETILRYLKTILETEEKYKGFTMLELVEVFRECTICELQRNAINDLQGLDIFVKCIMTTKEDNVKVNILWILRNISDRSNADKIRICANKYTVNESEIVRNVAMCVLWNLDILEYGCENIKNGNGVFINFAESDVDIATEIYEQLSNCTKVVLGSYENSCELKKSYDCANIIVLCVSEAFKNAGNFITGAEYCIKQNKVIFPVLVDKHYNVDGWLKKYVKTSSVVCHDLSNGNDSEWSMFKNDLNAHLVDDLITNNKDYSDADNSTMEVNTIIINDDEPSEVVSLWLSAHNLSHLQSKLSSFTMDMIFTLKNMRTDAPHFFFEALGKYLSLSFTEILQFDSALCSL